LAAWTANGLTYATDVYTQLYGTPYGGYLGTGTGFNALTGTGEKANVRLHVDDAVTYNTAAALTGSEWVAETVYREMCTPVGSGGTIWIYTGAYNAGGTWTTDNIPAAYVAWAVKNRAKSRDRQDPAGQMAFHGWGYSWLVNRRVFYNNGDVPGDVADYYMEPDSCSRLFVASAAPAMLNYSRWYRKYHGLSDKPSPVVAANTASPHYAGTTISFAGKFPGHTEPYETPRQDLLTAWGRNTKGTGAWDLVKADTKVAGRGLAGDPAAASYPLVLTTIRCVEHFQGGPITRNNPYNVELEPEPWIELNSSDARLYGILDGDLVKIVTARTEGVNGTSMMALYGSGFRARVGVGLATNQRVAAGVVAIPWHWGDKGLSTGSRANDLCIDAFDANSAIPEYKACLCRIEKM
jgi:formate dehydrogenase major subunit